MNVEGKLETFNDRGQQHTGLTKRARQAGAVLLTSLAMVASNPNAVAAETEEPEPAHEETVTSETGKSYDQTITPVCVDGTEPELHNNLKANDRFRLDYIQVKPDGSEEVLIGAGLSAGLELTYKTPWEDFNVGENAVTVYSTGVFEDDSTATSQTVTIEYPSCTNGEPEPEPSPEPEPTPDPDTGGPDDPLNKIDTIAGSNRFATTVAMSEAHFPPEETDTVVVATGENYPDALAGAALAGAHDAPILLSQRGELNHHTASEIDRLDVDNVVLLGGTAALSEQVELELEQTGLDVDRIAGRDRYATAARIAEKVYELNAQGEVMSQTAETDTVETPPESDTAELPPESDTAGTPEPQEPKQVYFASGEDFADALAVGRTAARTNTPILLTAQDSLPGPTRQWLNDQAQQVDIITTIGGTAAVSEAVAHTAANEAGAESERLAGSTRFTTSTAVETAGQQLQNEEGYELTSIYVTTGTNWPDALTAGPATATVNGAANIMVAGQNTSADAHVPFDEFIQQQKTASTEELVRVGYDDAIDGSTFGVLATIADGHPNNPSPLDPEDDETATHTNENWAARREDIATISG